MSLLAASINVDTARNIASGLSVGSLAVALLVLWLVKNAVMRVVSVVLLLALGLGSWSQRSSVTDCIDKVKSNAGQTTTTCSFFGQDVEIPALSK